MTSLHKQYRPAFVLAGYFWQAAMSWKVEEEKKKKQNWNAVRERSESGEKGRDLKNVHSIISAN